MKQNKMMLMSISIKREDGKIESDVIVTERMPTEEELSKIHTAVQVVVAHVGYVIYLSEKTVGKSVVSWFKPVEVRQGKIIEEVQDNV